MLSLLLLVVVAVVCAQDGPPVVDELIVSQYLGRWYQTYASPFVLGTEIRDQTCVSATYGIYNESTITVYNNGRTGAPGGPVSDISGYAYTTDEAGKLLVDFDLGFYGNYWVMQLGPVTEYDGVAQYAYSLVADPSLRNLYVLARDTKEFKQLYEDDCLNWLYANGFDKPTNNPLPIYHGDDCLYPEDVMEEVNDDLPVVDELDLPKYLGRWYTTFASPFVLSTEMNNQSCVNANYAIYNESTITVYNNGRTGAPDGPISDITGYAYTTDEAGKLLVDFGFGFYGDYWVMQLGPITEYNGVEQYAYSLVANPTRRNLYVLARDTEEFKNEYEEDCLNWLYANGFDSPTNNPLPVYQGDDCLYPEDVKEEVYEVPVVDELDLVKYLGRWYQTFASPFVLATELRDQTCVTGTYGVYNESTITVYNNGRVGAPDGPVSDISGYGYTTDEPGKLLVDFELGFLGDYWVMQLGPVNVYNGEEQYAYSLVADPSGRNLYVLARDPEEFKDVYEADCLTWLYANGFDSATNNPLPLYQGSDCLYPDL